MMFAIGAASSLLDSLQALTASNSSSASSSSAQSQAANPFDLVANTQTSANATGFSPGTSGYSAISPQTMSALLAAQSQAGTTSSTSTSTSPSDALQNLFNDIDTNGDGSITKAEFENALGAGGTNTAAADQVFNQLDTNGDGTVSLDELKSALQGAGGHHGGHHHMHAASSSSSSDSTNSDSSSDPSSDPLMQALAANTSSGTNSSTSTDPTASLTTIDKSQLPAITLSGSSSANSSYSMLQQALARAEQNFASTTASSLSVNV